MFFPRVRVQNGELALAWSRPVSQARLTHPMMQRSQSVGTVKYPIWLWPRVFHCHGNNGLFAVQTLCPGRRQHSPSGCPLGKLCELPTGYVFPHRMLSGSFCDQMQQDLHKRLSLNCSDHEPQIPVRDQKRKKKKKTVHLHKSHGLNKSVNCCGGVKRQLCHGDDP